MTQGHHRTPLPPQSAQLYFVPAGAGGSFLSQPSARHKRLSQSRAPRYTRAPPSRIFGFPAVSSRDQFRPADPVALAKARRGRRRLFLVAGPWENLLFFSQACLGLTHPSLRTRELLLSSTWRVKGRLLPWGGEARVQRQALESFPLRPRSSAGCRQHRSLTVTGGCGAHHPGWESRPPLPAAASAHSRLLPREPSIHLPPP